MLGPLQESSSRFTLCVRSCCPNRYCQCPLIVYTTSKDSPACVPIVLINYNTLYNAVWNTDQGPSQREQPSDCKNEPSSSAEGCGYFSMLTAYWLSLKILHGTAYRSCMTWLYMLRCLQCTKITLSRGNLC